MSFLNFARRGSNTPRTSQAKQFKVFLGIALVAITIGLGSTLAANININSGPVEFGQGVAQTTACDSAITITPNSSFDNSATPSPLPTPTTATGVFVLGSITVSGVDSGDGTGCDGKYLTLKGYGESSNTPLDLIDGTSSFTIYVNYGSDFTTPQSGFTVETIDSSSFTITFTSPTQSSSALYKLTIESSDTSPNPTPSPSESASSSPSGSPTGSGSATPCAPGIVNGTGDGLTISTPGTSAYQILQDYPASSSGLKWISLADVSCGMPFQIYADMDRDGGGWTLILANTANLWSYDQAQSINSVSAPSDPTDLTELGGKYSILSYADYIKKSATGFQYRMEASSYDAAGGIWTANQPYSFVSTSSTNTDITLDSQFGSWSYSDSGLEERMPYLVNSPQALLTTSYLASVSWWGTLIQADSWDVGPGPWIELIDARPAILWYWVR